MHYSQVAENVKQIENFESNKKNEQITYRRTIIWIMTGFSLKRELEANGTTWLRYWKKQNKTILSSKNSMMYGGRHTLW